MRLQRRLGRAIVRTRHVFPAGWKPPGNLLETGLETSLETGLETARLPLQVIVTAKVMAFTNVGNLSFSQKSCQSLLSFASGAFLTWPHPADAPFFKEPYPIRQCEPPNARRCKYNTFHRSLTVPCSRDKRRPRKKAVAWGWEGPCRRPPLATDPSTPRPRPSAKCV